MTAIAPQTRIPTPSDFKIRFGITIHLRRTSLFCANHAQMPPVRQNGYSQKRRANAERTFEAVIEVIYEAHVATGWLIEPFFQYVFRPSGGIPNPCNPVGVTTRIGDAAVFGLTSVLKY